MNMINLENFKISIFVWKKYVYLYIYNSNYFSLIRLNKTNKCVLRNNKTIEIKDKIHNNTVKRINLFLKQFYFYEYTKIKFTGKGYKVKKNSNKSIILLFNRAHTTTLWWKNMFIKKLKKYKMYIKYSYVQKEIIPLIIKTRTVNIFTKKGLRVSRQILYKKKGKK